MPRKPRVEYEGADYHVITRENRSEAIFRDDEDKRCREIARFLHRAPSTLIYIEQQLTEEEFKRILKRLKW